MTPKRANASPIDRRTFLAVTTASGAASLIRPASSAAQVRRNRGSDPLGVREDFPVALDNTYLNSAHTLPPPKQVAQAVADFNLRRSTHPAGLGSFLGKTEEARELFASLYGAEPEEIAFLTSTSDAENIVVSAVDWRPGDNVVVDDLHFTTSYLLYRELERTEGVELRVVKSVEGRPGFDQFESMVDDRTRMVSVSWVSLTNGFRHDVKALSALAHAHGAYLFTDAIQALGMVDADLHEEGVDFAAAGTYKWLMAGFGVAPFYIRNELIEHVQPDRLGWLAVGEERDDYQFTLHQSARKFEYATPAFDGMYQLVESLKYLERVGLRNIENHTVGLAQRLKAGLSAQGHTLLTPQDNDSAIVRFSHEVDPEVLRERFAEERLVVTYGNGGSEIRVGVALFNNQEDIDHLLDVMASF